MSPSLSVLTYCFEVPLCGDWRGIKSRLGTEASREDRNAPGPAPHVPSTHLSQGRYLGQVLFPVSVLFPDPQTIVHLFFYVFWSWSWSFIGILISFGLSLDLGLNIGLCLVLGFTVVVILVLVLVLMLFLS